MAEMLQSNSAMRQELEVQKTEVEAAHQSLADSVSTHSKALQVSWHELLPVSALPSCKPSNAKLISSKTPEHSSEGVFKML